MKVKERETGATGRRDVQAQMRSRVSLSYATSLSLWLRSPFFLFQLGGAVGLWIRDKQTFDYSLQSLFLNPNLLLQKTFSILNRETEKSHYTLQRSIQLELFYSLSPFKTTLREKMHLRIRKSGADFVAHLTSMLATSLMYFLVV